MRIAIPSDDQQRIAAHTGRCRGFVILDLNDGEAARVEYRSNTFTHHMQHGGEQHQHGMGHGGHSHGGLLSALADCTAMVALGMGPRLLDDLQARGIDVYFTRDLNVERVATALANGQLESDPRGSTCNHNHQHRH